MVALVTDGDRFLDVGEEFQLVFNIFWRKQTTVIDPADILGAVDDY
jgi:hypothetical protein